LQGSVERSLNVGRGESLNFGQLPDLSNLARRLPFAVMYSCGAGIPDCLIASPTSFSVLYTASRQILDHRIHAQ
jgi:hypothetical protein